MEIINDRYTQHISTTTAKMLRVQQPNHSYGNDI